MSDEAKKAKEKISQANNMKQCAAKSGANSSANQGPHSNNIVINDYAGDKNKLYVFDRNGVCLFETDVSYGRGSKGKPPAAGCTSGANGTPAGWHVLQTHNGARYNSENSFALQDLQGQKSGGRAILLHVAKSDQGPTTLGCSGVLTEKFNEMKQKNLIGPGTLVNNVFAQGKDGDCDIPEDVCNPGVMARDFDHYSEDEQGDDNGGGISGSSNGGHR